MRKIKKLIPLMLTLVICLGLFIAGMLLLPRQESSANPATPPKPSVPTTPETPEPAIPPNVFSPKDFDYEDEYLICLTHPYIRGLDVSTFQKQIDWEQVREAGFQFVIIRLGFRGLVEGDMEEDEWAQINYQGAREAGLKVGGYFFSQAITPEEAVEEAEFAMQIVKDWELDMPLVYDWEFVKPEYRTGNVDARTLTDCTIAFCETVKAGGYEPMVYFNPRQSEKQMYLEELTDYGFWLAMYNNEMDFPYKVDMWQYTSTGTVPGIQGNVDINLFFPYEEDA